MYKVTPLICADMTVPKPQVFRNRGWGESAKIASVAWLIQRCGVTTLIDTSLGGTWTDPDFATTRASLVDWKLHGNGVSDQLAACGLALSDIDRVILTHLHIDHIASLPSFTNAEIVLSRRGWDCASAERHPWLNTYSHEVLDWIARRRDRVRMVADDEVIEGDIRLRWLGGHSPCSQAVILPTRAGLAAFAGDVVPMKENWKSNQPTGHYQNLREVADAYDFLEQFEEIVPGHDPVPPQWMESLP